MKANRPLAFVTLLAALTLACNVGQTITPSPATPLAPPSPIGPPPTQLESPSPALAACKDLGQVLGPSDFGVAAGLAVADVSALRLEAGRIRLFVFVHEQGLRTATSTGSDGLAFRVEAGFPYSQRGAGMPRVVRLEDGRIRLFFIEADGIKSAISEDGVAFTMEPGFRVTREQAGFGDAMSGATVVALPDATFRMYFSDLPRPGEGPGGHAIKSAVSTDMLEWTMEDGVRIGVGAPTLTASAEHPFALAHPDGSVTLYYAHYEGPGSGLREGLYRATSTDGLAFETEEFLIAWANDPDVLRQPDGTLLVYYGTFSADVGGTIRAAQCSP